MASHVVVQVGDADGVDNEKFVPRTNNDKAEYEAWLQRQQAKLRNFGGGRGAKHHKTVGMLRISSHKAFAMSQGRKYTGQC